MAILWKGSENHVHVVMVMLAVFVHNEFMGFYLSCVLRIGNRTISSTIWKLIDTSNVLKVLVIARADRRVQFKNFKNITSVY